MNLIHFGVFVIFLAVVISESVTEEQGDIGVHKQLLKRFIDQQNEEPSLIRFRRSIRKRHRKRKIMSEEVADLNDGHSTNKNKRTMVAGGGMMYDVYPIGEVPPGGYMPASGASPYGGSIISAMFGK